MGREVVSQVTLLSDWRWEEVGYDGAGGLGVWSLVQTDLVVNFR